MLESHSQCVRLDTKFIGQIMYIAILNRSLTIDIVETCRWFSDDNRF